MVSSYLRNKYQGKKLVLAGEGKAGLWAVMAAPLADAVIADCNQVNEQSDDIYLDRNLFFPGIHRMGDFQGVLALAVPHPLLLHNAGHQMSANWIKPLYNNLEVGQKFNFSESKYSDAQLANWLGTQKI